MTWSHCTPCNLFYDSDAAYQEHMEQRHPEPQLSKEEQEEKDHEIFSQVTNDAIDGAA